MNTLLGYIDRLKFPSIAALFSVLLEHILKTDIVTSFVFSAGFMLMLPIVAVIATLGLTIATNFATLEKVWKDTDGFEQLRSGLKVMINFQFQLIVIVYLLIVISSSPYLNDPAYGDLVCVSLINFVLAVFIRTCIFGMFYSFHFFVDMAFDSTTHAQKYTSDK